MGIIQDKLASYNKQLQHFLVSFRFKKELLNEIQLYIIT